MTGVFLYCQNILQLISHLELVSQHKDDDLKCGSSTKWILVQDLLLAPALILQSVAHNAQCSVEPWVEVKCHISPRLYTAATCEVHLEPARQHREHTGEQLPSDLSHDGIRWLTCWRLTAQIPGSEPSLLAANHPGWSQQMGSSVRRTFMKTRSKQSGARTSVLQ